MSWPPPAVPVLVLAAGSAARFGADKLLVEVAGQPLLAWTLEGVLDAVEADHALVVLGPDAGARASLCEAAGVATVVAADAARGMRWSMAEGLEACPPVVPGAIVVLADDPLTLRALPGVLSTARRAPDRPAAVRRDPFLPHPVYLPREAWPQRPEGDADHGLRDLLEDGRAVTWIDDEGPHPVDVDVASDVQLLESALSAS